jgi:RimJ/RimL family protein N-acetyltransferase
MYRGEKIVLRAITSADAESCARWMNDRETVINSSGGGRMPISVEEERDYLMRNSYCTFGIQRVSDGELIGTCSFFDVNHQARSCKIGILIGDRENRGRGYGADAMKTLLHFLFIDRNMHRVALEVFEYNEPAVALYEKLGFVRECTYRQQVYAMGRYWDEYGYSMLRREYEGKYGD